MDLQGLGKEIWQGVDVRQYLDELRDDLPELRDGLPELRDDLPETDA